MKPLFMIPHDGHDGAVSCVSQPLALHWQAASPHLRLLPPVHDPEPQLTHSISLRWPRVPTATQLFTRQARALHIASRVTATHTGLGFLEPPRQCDRRPAWRRVRDLAARVGGRARAVELWQADVVPHVAADPVGRGQRRRGVALGCGCMATDAHRHHHRR